MPAVSGLRCLAASGFQRFYRAAAVSAADHEARDARLARP